MEKKTVKNDIFYLSTDVAKFINLKTIGGYIKNIEDNMKVKKVIKNKTSYYINYDAIALIVNKKFAKDKTTLSVLMEKINTLKTEKQSSNNASLGSAPIKENKDNDLLDVLNTQKRIIANLVEIQKKLQVDVRRLKIIVGKMELKDGKYCF